MPLVSFPRALLCAALLTAGGASARDNAVHADAAFMKEAAAASLAEVQAGRLAVQKARHTQVKGFGQQMVDDHGRTHEELKALAASKNISLPEEPARREQSQIRALQDLSGVKFDERYADQFGVKAHEDTVRLFQQASQKSKDAEVKAWVDKTLPVLQNHLQMAKDIRNVVRADADKPGPAAAR